MNMILTKKVGSNVKIKLEKNFFPIYDTYNIVYIIFNRYFKKIKRVIYFKPSWSLGVGFESEYTATNDTTDRYLNQYIIKWVLPHWEYF